MSGIDVAAWDALAGAAGLPLAGLLGGEARPVPAYGSLRTMTLEDAPGEAAELSGSGFDSYKVKIGRPDPGEDLAAIRAVKDAVGGGTRLAVDFNQLLSVPEAVGRGRVLREEGVWWVEEPTRADDFAGHARIRREPGPPVQLGENWWGTQDMAKSLSAGASDFGMPDVMRMGGVTGWLRAAALAEAAGLPLSSHLYVEVSAHLLAVTPTAHYLEYLDVAAPILEEPLRIEDGRAVPLPGPGVGMAWDEDAVDGFLVR